MHTKTLIKMKGRRIIPKKRTQFKLHDQPVKLCLLDIDYFMIHGSYMFLLHEERETFEKLTVTLGIISSKSSFYNVALCTITTFYDVNHFQENAEVLLKLE